MAASWPTSVATDANLYIAVNALQTNLSAGIDNAVTTIGLNSTSNFPTAGTILIDNEVIKYTGVSGASLTGCTRGFDGTSAASHSSGAVVSFAIVADHHNVLKDEIKAIETYLSNNLGTGSQPLATGHRALASNASGKIVEVATTDTELGYVSGVTSAIQTQLNAKAPTASPTFTGTIGTPLTASRALQTDASSNLQASSVTTTELGYLSGVTSAIQTQLNAKAPTASPTFTGTVTVPNGVGATDAAAFGQISGKRILQIVAVNVSTSSTGNSTTYTDTVLTGSITCASTSSKVFIFAAAGIGNFTATKQQFFTIARNGTDLSSSTNGFGGPLLADATGSFIMSWSGIYLDSPASVSALTYTVRAKNDASGTFGLNSSGSNATMYLVEIG